MESGKPGVFISYSRKDLRSAQKLEKIFQAEGLRVWRDQESIYAGEQWPKAIGQAIENESIFLLLWSKHSADSHFVEFEWNTALALKKTIVPVLLDNTQLPAALRAINGILFENTGKTIKKLLELMAVSPPSPHRQNPRVIHELSQIKEKSIEAVLNRVKTIYQQQGWHVYGNVYQVSAENIHLTSDQQSKKWWEKWQVKVTFVILLLMLLTFVFEIPEKAKKFYRGIFGEPPATCSLKGVVQDSKRIPVSGVEVKVDALPGQSAKTTGSGSFKFEKVPGRVGDDVRVTAHYKGRLAWDEYVTLPGPVTIILEDP
ncbi:MAG: TIR domain-containing protein [Candidatus Aminicenantes bacterium]|jgi:hypothetical protein